MMKLMIFASVSAALLLASAAPAAAPAPEQVEALRLAIKDLSTSFPAGYTRGAEFLQRLAAVRDGAAFAALQREALLANPLLDFDQLLVLRRDFGAKADSVMSRDLGMPALNSHVHNTIKHHGWSNEIAVLSNLRSGGQLRTLYHPEATKMLCDVDLHFSGQKLLFSSIGRNDAWAIFEMNADGSRVSEITPTNWPVVDFFDACYLPNGKLALTSTASYQGLPCEGGSKPMAQLYLMDGAGEPGARNIRQITFEQDSDWCPTMLNNGRLMYLRWEYVDLAHYFSRILFHCNPDGTDQREYYHSNSYFPNSFFFARPIPGHASMVVGVAGGHHGISRSGRLLLIDPARGRSEAEGVVQEIPGRGKKVEPIIRDQLVNGVWPQFLHPYPLSDKYFLVACKPTARSLWGIYLVDVFDNMLPLKEVEGAALLEPVPFRATPVPPVLPERVKPEQQEARVFLVDIYHGGGLKDVPRGTVKALRLFSYHFAHVGRGGHNSVGEESSWDIKRVLGTVPVEADGSASFRIPANTPLAIQPLDADGRALQLMRSWFVGMPGENVSCVGCHERQNNVAPAKTTLAAQREPSEIKPWYGAPRPFSFRYEVQPVLDKYCGACHGAGRTPDFTAANRETDYRHDKAYMALQLYVRRPGPESDIHMFDPLEYHAGTSELMQMLRKGHHGVQLDREAWERLATWIDLNAPYRGKWDPGKYRNRDQHEGRLDMAQKFACRAEDPEAEYDRLAAEFAKRPPIQPGKPSSNLQPAIANLQLPGWPFDTARAKQMQQGAGDDERELDIADDSGQKHAKVKLHRIPAGRFVMGSAIGASDETPQAAVDIGKPFWMTEMEISNELFNLFDPAHDSRFIDKNGKDHSDPGLPANRPEQPVIRVSWDEAQRFCAWLSRKTGRRCALPTEAQWEWACRAGTATPMWYGATGDDWSRFANMADTTKVPTTAYPRNEKVNDHQGVPDSLGRYAANAWGLKDMHGSVAEWTRSAYRPYPYREPDGRNDAQACDEKVVRGGSWCDRPFRCTSSYRLPYQPWQRVANVGFRIIVEDAP